MRSMQRRTCWTAAVVVVALGATACGSSSTKSGKGGSGSTSATTVPPPPESHASQVGVTATTIKIGVAEVDFKPIQQFIDFNHGDEQEVTQTFVNAINKNGGILGRKLEAVYMKYTPIGSQGPTQVCT